MSLAADTLITVPGGTSQISKLNVGAFASAWSINGITNQPIFFSQGSDSPTEIFVIYIRTENSTLITSPAQRMCLADQTLKRADQLVPNSDLLLLSDGQPENIESIILGRYNGLLHHIAINTMELKDKHLIIANGLVCGDFVLEMLSDTAST